MELLEFNFPENVSSDFLALLTSEKTLPEENYIPGYGPGPNERPINRMNGGYHMGHQSSYLSTEKRIFF